MLIIMSAEAQLWLYRTHNDHKRVLAILSDDKSTGEFWTKRQAYVWTADYLSWLWKCDDAMLTSLVLPALRPVLEYDAQLGLCVLISSSSAGGGAGAGGGAKGVPSTTGAGAGASAGGGGPRAVCGKGVSIQEVNYSTVPS